MASALRSRLSLAVCPDLTQVANNSGIQIGTTAMNTSTIKVAATMTMPMESGINSDTITHVGYYQSTMGVVSTNGYKIGVQGIAVANGNPDGTYLGGGSPASAEFTPVSGNNGKWVWVALANSISINRGAEIALVVEAGSGYTASDSLTVGKAQSLTSRIGFPILQTATGGTWTKNTSDLPALGMKSANYVYGFPIKAGNTTKAYGGTVEAAVVFQIPSTWWSTCKLLGVRANLNTTSTGKQHVVSVYSLGNAATNAPSSPPTQATISIDSDNASSANSAFRTMEFNFDSTSPPALTAGNWYAIGFQTTTGSDGAVYTFDVETAADFGAYSMGVNAAYGTRTTAAFANPQTSTVAFTVTTTSRPYVELILDDITAPAGGGGLAANPIRGFVS